MPSVMTPSTSSRMSLIFLARARALSVVFGGVGMIVRKPIVSSGAGSNCAKLLFMRRSAVAIVIGFVLLLPVIVAAQRTPPTPKKWKLSRRPLPPLRSPKR